MERAVRDLLLVSILLLLVQGIGAVIAIAENLPADHFLFGGTPGGMAVSESFLLGLGTALSANLPALLAQGVLTVLALNAGTTRTVGEVGLTLLGGAYLLGYLGEAITIMVLSPTTFDLSKAPLVATGIILALLMLIFGLRAIAWGRRSRHEAR